MKLLTNIKSKFLQKKIKREQREELFAGFPHSEKKFNQLQHLIEEHENRKKALKDPQLLKELERKIAEIKKHQAQQWKMMNKDDVDKAILELKQMLGLKHMLKRK